VPWVRFDDQFPIHRKVAGLSDRAFRLHSEAIFWCARNLTDGFIAEDELANIAPRIRGKVKLTDEYVEKKLWHHARDACTSEKCPAPQATARPGWIIHDYWEYQPSSEQVRHEREANARRQQQWRDAHRNAVTDTVTAGVSNSVSNPPRNSAPARPFSGTGLNQGDPPPRARARPTPNSNGQVNPGEGAAARHPSARPLADAQRAAGLEPGHQPARGHTVASFADQIRQAINKPQQDGP
jgi:hypothetical protein